MGNFFSKYKYILAAIVAIFAIFIGYGYMKPSSGNGPEGISTVVVSNDIGGGQNANGLAGELSESFVVQLLAIQNINFNTEFFNDPVYRGLVDQSRPLGERPVGRPNPFFPIGQDNGFVGGSTSGLDGSSSVASTTPAPATTTPARATTTRPTNTRTPAR